ncbi:MAG TPA: hypothetical protein VFS21_20330 [Roseiflexaceae bacterium]|nr:hypothetical protein [Roseiflexaceae bacterium]
MPPRFFFAIGDRPRPRDLIVALAVGQRDFLVPFTSTILPALRDHPEVQVAVDSRAWPPDDPDRPSLDAYVRHLLSWRKPDGSWGNLAWAAAYDHLRDPGRTQADLGRLLGLLSAAGAADCPIVPVRHYDRAAGRRAAEDILLDFAVGAAGARADLIDGCGDLDRPGYGIGALVPVLRPIATTEERATAAEWLRDLRQTLEHEAEDAGVDLELLGLHLFGIGQPALVNAPFVASFDSSGPARLAAFGWRKIRPTFQPAYGLAAEKLQRSREARLAYWLMRYRESVGLPWCAVPAGELLDDVQQPAVVQHSLALSFA